MLKIFISPLAERDLIDIWHYSHAQWGEAQADEYLGDLDKGMQRLAGNPNRGASRAHVRQGYRVLSVKSHAIYYKVTAPVIHVIRVLHVRMDPDGNL